MNLWKPVLAGLLAGGERDRFPPARDTLFARGLGDGSFRGNGPNFGHTQLGQLLNQKIHSRRLDQGLAESDAARQRSGAGGGESLVGDRTGGDLGQSNSGFISFPVKNCRRVPRAEPEDIVRMMGLFFRQVAGGQVWVIKAVAGHGSNLEKFLRPLEKGVPLGVGMFITKFGKTLEGVFLGRI